jgi:hypothetical protein
VQKLLANYPYSDFEPFYQPMNTLVSKLINWELMGEKEIDWTLKTLKLITKSRIQGLLAEPRYLDQLIKIIEGQNFPLNI